MVNISSNANQTEQPGLEVVVHEGLEVAKSDFPEAVHPISPSNESKWEADATKSAPKTSTFSRRPILWASLALAALIVIVGAVLGGVLGSRAMRIGSQALTDNQEEKNDSQPKSSDSPSKQRTAAPGSALAVTSTRLTKGYQIYLYFQDKAGNLRFTKYNSSADNAWTKPSVLNSEAANGTDLGVSTIIWSEGYQPQLELFYSNSAHDLLGRSVNNLTDDPNADDSIRAKTIKTDPQSAIATYWPWVAYIGGDSQLRTARNYQEGSTISSGPSDQWTIAELGVDAKEGSGLAIVPTSTNFTDIKSDGGYAIFYVGKDGYKLSAYIPEGKSSKATWDPATLFNSTLSEDSPIAAFAVARKNSANEVNTYVLCRNTEGKIEVTSNESGAGWNIETPAALQDADSDTNLACITMPTSVYDITGQELLLEEESGLTRCYFQQDGEIREVAFNNGNWSLTGTIIVT